nr:MAG TPA: hypothetical protein [Caudoviricetes sp.]
MTEVINSKITKVMDITHNLSYLPLYPITG